MEIRVEEMNDHFTKLHLIGFSTPMVLHEFTAADGPASDFHDHPFAAHIQILDGGYVEEVLIPEHPEWAPERVVRRAGDEFVNGAGTVHRIVELLDGPVLTLFRPLAHERDSGFYRIHEGRTLHRYWFEGRDNPDLWYSWPRYPDQEGVRL